VGQDMRGQSGNTMRAVPNAVEVGGMIHLGASRAGFAPFAPAPQYRRRA
jgi:hypothetical protein